MKVNNERQTQKDIKGHRKSQTNETPKERQEEDTKGIESKELLIQFYHFDVCFRAYGGGGGG